MYNKLFIAILLLMSFGATSCQNNSTEKKTDIPQNIRCFRVSLTNDSNEHSFPFITQPYRTTNLSFRVGGVIEQFEVQSGNFYRKGNLIASIDPRDYALRLARYEALYKQVEAEFKRIETLYKANNIAASTYDKSKADYATSLTAYQTAQNELSDTRLVAPFDGYIQSVFIERYQDVRPTQPIISFIEIDRIKIETYIPQFIAKQIKKGTVVTTSLDDTPNDTYQAVVSDVSKSTTENNLSYLLTATLDNASHQLLAGMSGNLHIETTPTSNSTKIVIPQTALRNKEKSGTYVWIVDPKTHLVSIRNVTVGTLLKAGYVSITEGLSKDELIATTGLDFLSPNKPVSIIGYEQ